MDRGINTEFIFPSETLRGYFVVAFPTPMFTSTYFAVPNEVKYYWEQFKKNQDTFEHVETSVDDFALFMQARCPAELLWMLRQGGKPLLKPLLSVMGEVAWKLPFFGEFMYNN